MIKIIKKLINLFNKKNKDKKINKNKKDNLIFGEGVFFEKDEISPTYVNTDNYKYIEIDDIYYSSILIVNYYREQEDIILKNLIDSNISMNISIFYEKQDTYKTIKDLTYHIGNVGVDLKENNQNRQDIDLVAFTYSDAKYIRREMQVNNEDLYFLNIYITIFSENKKELEYLLNKIEGLAQASGMQTRRAYFREEAAFFTSLPFMQNLREVKDVTKRNVLTSSLVSTYPFISSSIFDEEGIYIGTNIYNNSLIFIDRYNTEKYKNANMCIFGTSGARKIFLYQTNYYKIQINGDRTICY